LLSPEPRQYVRGTVPHVQNQGIATPQNQPELLVAKTEKQIKGDEKMIPIEIEVFTSEDSTDIIGKIENTCNAIADLVQTLDNYGLTTERMRADMVGIIDQMQRLVCTI